jgi:anionic cell wall polymer biosynthesis LytR-Cps2A-Psr (LCP) family protein
MRIIGVEADYYVAIDFRGFVTLIDLIGGIDVVVERTIDDPNYPGFNDESYEHLIIEAGPHHFDGEMALKFARSRHDSNDFDRARRQQQVLRAVLQRVTDLNMLPQMIRQTPEIIRTLGATVKTDLPLGKLLRLATAAGSIEASQVRSGVIDHTCTRPWVTPYGGQVLLPIPECIRAVRDSVFQIPSP